MANKPFLDIKIDGAKQLARTFKRMPAGLRTRGYRYALTAASRKLRDKVKSAAPRDTGLLKKSLKTLVRVNSRDHYGGITVKKEAFYWFWQEYGTRNQQPRPFVYNTFQAMANDIVKSYTDAINKYLGTLK